jgi:hypothetical protein
MKDSLKTSDSGATRATVYFEEGLHYALRIKAAQLQATISELVNKAVKVSLAEDAEDLEAFEKRASEPDVSFENVLKNLKKRGKI